MTDPEVLRDLIHTHTHDGHTHTHVSPAVPAGPAPRLHLAGVLLPEGEPTDVWIVDGLVTFDPVADALTVATGVWIMPGLVDAHAHVGLGARGAVDQATTEQQAVTDRDAGALLIRDAGSPADTRWIDERVDLPRMIRAGRHVARTRRYIRNYADEVEPDDLVAAVQRQAERGDRWVKLVGDWIDREAGDLTPSFPADAARAAIAAAHDAGARVTAHCFGEQSVAELVDAGIDGIEHGTGLDDATIEVMAERQVALVPTLDNLDIFPGIADDAEAKFPRYAAHLRDLYARRWVTYGKAYDAGVPIYAGTDAGGVGAHGRIVDEIEALSRVGGVEFALGAASWRAREWLGRSCLGEGDSADLVVFAEDPRVHLGTAREPVLVILRGRIVSGRSSR